MATISGFLKFDRARNAVSSDASLPGIANVPIVLQNTATNEMLTVYTDGNGKYTFNNVPDGNYRIVESYGKPASASPGDFSTAAPGEVATAAFPPISYASNPPADATNLDCTTPNTLLVTVAGADLTEQNILNGPVKYTPIHTLLDTGVVILPGNLITDAANGEFGTFPQGTPANTGAEPNPYPGIGSQFTYSQPNTAGVTPGAGGYTIQNTMNDATATVQNTWWRISDHTNGNETGRMMVVNGDDPGKVLFQQKITVKPETYYLMSSWILNMSKNADLVDPQLGVQVLDSNGQVLYNATLGTLIPRNPDNPEWKQIGTVINSQNNTAITLRFTSMGPEAVGNDYAIDDVALNEVIITAYVPQKSANRSVAHVGDVVTYTVVLDNTGSNPLQNVTIQDAVPDGFTFIPGTVTINGTANTEVDPNTGFSVPDISSGNKLTVTFQATADYIPTVNPTINNAKAKYSYTPVVGGIPDVFTKTSNDVVVPIEAAQADLSVTKTGDRSPVFTGNVLTYTLNARNNGPDIARNVTLTDPIPSTLLSPEYSSDGGNTWKPWNGTYPLNTLPSGAGMSLLIRGTVSNEATGVITNTATINSTTSDPNPNNNSSTVLTPITNLADLSIIKTGDQSPIHAGNRITYTLTTTNSGPNAASKVTITDNTPTDLLNPEYSTDGGATWKTWNGEYTINTLETDSKISILIRGTVSNSAMGVLTNTSTVSSSTNDPNPNNNSSTVLTPITTSADMSVVKTVDQSPIQAGKVLTYTLTATNNGPNDARNVTLTDNVQSSVLTPEYSADGGNTWNTWYGTYNAGTVPTGRRVAILIRGTVNNSATGVLTNTSAVSSSTDDPNPNNNSSTVLTPIITSADLSIVKTGNQSPVQAGNVLTYTLTATNNGPNDARNVTITDTPPSNLLAPEYSIDNGRTWQTWNGTYELNSLAPGTETTILIRGTVSNSATGVLTNASSVSSTTPDPDPDNNSSTVLTPITTLADVSIVKTGNQNPIQAGNVLTYTLTATNNGPNDARNVTLTDAVPDDLLTPEYSIDNGRTWQTWSGTYELNTLVPGAGVTILLRGKVSNSAAGVLTNAAEVRSSTPDPNPDNNTSTVLTPITTSADISVVKTADQSPIQAGKILTYTLTATNNGPNDARDVILTDNIPADLLTPEYSIDNGRTWQAWNGTYELNTLVSGVGVTVNIRGTVSNSATGVLTNAATVSSTTPDPDPNNNKSTILTPIITSADLSVTKTADKSPIQAGKILTYTLTATNNGPNDAKDVKLTDATPNNLSAPEYSVDNGNTWQPWSGTHELNLLPSGNKATVLIRGTVSNEATGVLTNTATVSSSTPDPDPDNNKSTILTPIITSADLSIKKTADQSPIQAGKILTYTLAVTNNGPNSAYNVTFTDNTPIDLQGAEYSADGGVTWKQWNGTYNLTALSAGGISSILIRGTVNNSAKDVITNSASVSSPTPDPDPDNNTSIIITPITTLADISVSKTADQNPILAGKVLTYTLAVTNNGPNDAINVILTDNIPDTISQPEYSADGGVTWQTWNGTHELGTLTFGTTTSILIRGKVNDSTTGTIINTATASSLTKDPNPDNNSSTILTPITNLADIAVTKKSSPSPVQAGNILTYTLTATNNGPNRADNVTLVDETPNTLLSPEYSVDGGSTWFEWVNIYDIGILAAGDSKNILIRGTVSPSATGILTNTANIRSSTPDPDPDNNSNTVVTPINTSADISVTKKGDKTPIQAGNILTYTLTATNSGPNDALNVVLTDETPDELLSPEYSDDEGVTWQTWNGTYTLGTLAVNGSKKILIRGTVNSSSTGVITNNTSIASTTPDPDPNNNRDTDITPINTSADLSVTKTGNQSPIQAGNVLTYTLTATNNGPNNALDVILTDETPANLLSPEYSADGGNTWQIWSGTYNINVLASNASASILIRGTVDPLATGTVINTANVSSKTPDPDPNNNGNTVRTPITTIADLSIVKTAGQSPVQAGNTLTYTLTATNNGPNNAADVTITDNISEMLLTPEYSVDGGTTWHQWQGGYTYSNLTPNESTNILIRGTVSPSAEGIITNVATVSSPTPDPNPNNNSSTVMVPITTAADLEISKTVNQNSVQTGNILIYTLTATNKGPNIAHDITLTDETPGELLLPEYSVDGGVTWQTWNGSYTITAMTPGQISSILIRATVSPSASGSITNAVTISSKTPDPDPNNNRNTVITPIITSADLSVVKTADQSPIQAGNTLTYTLKVTNNGPNDAGDVTLKDETPNELLTPQYSADGGITWKNWEGTYIVGDMPLNTSASILIRGTVNVSSTGSLTNTATVSSPTPDPNPNNNSDTVITPINTSADLSVIKIGDKSPVQTGDVLTYTITATNNGPNDANDVILNDKEPSNLLSPEYSYDGGVTWHTWNGVYTLNKLANSVSVSILLRGKVAKSERDLLTNTATIGSSTPDPNPNNNSSIVLTPITSTADISIIKTGDKSPVQTGNILTYTLTAANNGPDDAIDVVITDETPDNLLTSEYSSDGGLTWQTWSGTYTLNTLANGTSASILIRGTVNNSDKNTVANVAIISSKTPDPDPNNNTSTVITPVNTFADLAITKTVDKSPVQAGDTLTYKLTVTNKGPDNAQSVTVIDNTPLDIIGAEYSVDGGIRWRQWRNAYTFSNLALNESAVILIRGTVSSSATGVLTNLATVSSPTPDPDPKNNSDTVLTPIITSADLQITKTGDKSEVQSGNVLTYILTATNNGPNIARDVNIVDKTPAELLNTEYSVDGGTTWQTWDGTYNAGDMAPNASISILIRSTLSDSATGTLANTATVSSPTPDPKHSNNSDTELTPIITAADLQITKKGDTSLIQTGNIITYTLTATNNGPNIARDVTIIDETPVTLISPEYSADNGATWHTWQNTYTIGDLIPNTSTSILIRGTVSPSASGVLTNTATVSSPTPDPDPGNNNNTELTPIITSADLQITKSGDKSELQAGDILTYTLTATNNGPNIAQDVTITDETPKDLLLPEYSLDGGATWQSWKNIFTVPTLPPNVSVSILIRGTVSNSVSGKLTNAATISSRTPDPKPNNNTDTDITNITTVTDVAIIKSADKSTVQAGSVITYTLTATNNGPNTAHNVIITDETSQDLLSPEYSTDGGITWKQWNDSYTIGTLETGAIRSILLRGTVSNSVGSTLTNATKISSSTTDSNLKNNTSTVTTPIKTPVINNSADLSIVKTADKSSIQEGNILNYTLTVTNNGPDTARDITLTDTPSNELLSPEYSDDNGTSWHQWDGTYTLGTLAANTNFQILIRGTISSPSSGTLTNTATVKSPTPDPNLKNNSSTVLTPIDKYTDISVVKTACPRIVKPCGTIVYTIKVYNAGPAPAKNVILKDILPSEIIRAKFSADDGKTWHEWSGSKPLGTLDAQTGITVLIRGKLDRCLPCKIKNCSIVYSSTPDLNLKNNKSEATVKVCKRHRQTL